MIEESREIINRAICEYNPYAIVAMVSGGDDSLTAVPIRLLDKTGREIPPPEHTDAAPDGAGDKEVRP